MKIGILTFHDTNNFGSCLQTYGLYKGICDLGYDCEVIDYQCDNIVKRERPDSFVFTLNPRSLYVDFFVGRKLREKYKKLIQFTNEKMKLSCSYTKKTISQSHLPYSKIFVGSDIVWGLDITDCDTTYFLDFFKSHAGMAKKYAFSSSIGNPWSEKQKEILKPLLYDFSKIAVREEESAEWVDDIISIRPAVVCDPTMLLSPSEWKEVSSDKYKGRRYVLVYFPTEKNLEDAKKYAKQNNIDLYVIGLGRPILEYKLVWPTRLEDFLSLLRYAQYVFTGSYHGMLFSIYFERQFSYYNRAHKSRMNTLARKFHLENREGCINERSIDYDIVREQVDEYRTFSISILKNMLEE